MALKTSTALAPMFLALALTLILAGCGGGSTGGPIATTTGATSPAPGASAPPEATTSPTTRTAAQRAPTAAPTTTPRTSARRAPSDVEALPDTGGRAAASASAPAATTPTTEQPAPAASAAPDPTGSPLDETAELTLVERISPAHYIQQGTVTGTYDGTMEVEARITSKGVLVRFTATLVGGTISGRGVAVAILDSTTWPGLRGRAIVTGGTGRFADIRGRRLKVTGRARPDASRARVRLAGIVRLK